MRTKLLLFATLAVSLQASAQNATVPQNIVALRSQVEQDNASLRQLAKQITDTQSATLEQSYVVARLKLDQDVIRLRQAADPLLEPGKQTLRQLFAQAEAAQIAGDAQAPSLRTQYRQQEASFKAYRATLVGDF